ncbi:MAG: Arm DNA-binding domain-containing protein [Pseudomonadota bacterium]
MSIHFSGKLTQKFVTSVKEAGRYGDGSGLYLLVKRSGSKSWMLRVVIMGRRTDIGLGGLSYTPLQEARRKAQELRAVARNGGDPRVSKRKKEVPTFEELAHEVHKEWTFPIFVPLRLLTCAAFPLESDGAFPAQCCV